MRGKPGFSITGTASDVARGTALIPYVKFDSRTTFEAGVARIRPGDEGAFTWSRRGLRGVQVYVETVDGTVRSNAVTIAR